MIEDMSDQVRPTTKIQLFIVVEVSIRFFSIGGFARQPSSPESLSIEEVFQFRSFVFFFAKDETPQANPLNPR